MEAREKALNDVRIYFALQIQYERGALQFFLYFGTHIGTWIDFRLLVHACSSRHLANTQRRQCDCPFN